jgi:hypothetical protein
VEVLKGENPQGRSDPATTRARFQADQANQIVKKIALGLAVGYARMYISTVQDWPNYFIWIWNFAGFFDTKRYLETRRIDAPGVRKPMYWAIRFWIPHIVGSTAAAVVHENTDNGIASYCTYVVKLDHPAGNRYIMWSDKPDGDAYELHTAAATVRVYTNITAQDQQEAEAAVRTSGDGVFRIALDSTPRLIQADD